MVGTNGANGQQPQHDASDLLLDRLNEPGTAAALNLLLDHADLLAYSVTALDSLLRRGEEFTENVAFSIAEVRQALPDAELPAAEQVGRLARQIPQLIDTAAQLAELAQRPEFLATMETLSKPATLDAVNRLLGHLDLVVYLVSGLDALAQRGEQLTDNLRDSLQEVGAALPASGADVFGLLDSLARFLPYIPRLVAVAPKFIEVIERLEKVVSAPEFDALLSSGVFQPDTVALVGRAGDAFVASYAGSRRSDRRMGLISLLRALNDPDVQRAAALVMDFGRRFGSSIR